ADPEVGVVVRLVRGLDDPADELRARAHVGRGEGGAQRPADDPPVLEPGLPGDLCSGQRLHGPTVGPRGPTAGGTVASGPPASLSTARREVRDITPSWLTESRSVSVRSRCTQGLSCGAPSHIRTRGFTRMVMRFYSRARARL